MEGTRYYCEVLGGGGGGGVHHLGGSSSVWGGGGGEFITWGGVHQFEGGGEFISLGGSFPCTPHPPLWILLFNALQVLYVVWHPSASDVLLSAGGDYTVFVWNTKTREALSTIKVHDHLIQSVSWNYDGSYFATSCRDKKLRIIDPRTRGVISVSKLQRFKKEGDGGGGGGLATLGRLEGLTQTSTIPYNRL